MSNHTPGPWNYFPKLSGSENHKGFHIVAPKYTVADCIPVDADGIRGEANARLIASAPELLEALKAVLYADLYADAEGLVSFAYPNTVEGEAAAEIARRAIAKATGND